MADIYLFWCLVENLSCSSLTLLAGRYCALLPPAASCRLLHLPAAIALCCCQPLLAGCLTCRPLLRSAVASRFLLAASLNGRYHTLFLHIIIETE